MSLAGNVPSLQLANLLQKRIDTITIVSGISMDQAFSGHQYPLCTLGNGRPNLPIAVSITTSDGNVPTASGITFRFGWSGGNGDWNGGGGFDLTSFPGFYPIIVFPQIFNGPPGVQAQTIYADGTVFICQVNSNQASSRSAIVQVLGLF
jgi:hypothetical protein